MVKGEGKFEPYDFKSNGQKFESGGTSNHPGCCMRTRVAIHSSIQRRCSHRSGACAMEEQRSPKRRMVAQSDFFFFCNPSVFHRTCFSYRGSIYSN